MRKFLTMAACAVWPLLAGAGQAVACSTPMGAQGIERALLGWINAERDKKGLAALAPTSTLQDAAGRHACALARQGKLSHRNFAQRIHGAGFGIGVENVAMSTEASAAAAARIWKRSGGHWANILNRDVRQIGLATATADGRTYYVLMAGAP